MVKFQEVADPNSCLNKAKDSELVFVLVERDAASPAAIRAWIAERIRLGLNRAGDNKLVEAERTAEAIAEANYRAAAKSGK